LPHLGDDELERTLTEWKNITAKKVPEGLKKHLSRIRRQGHETQPSYLVRGVVNISCPIFDERASAIGALTIPYIEYKESKLGLAEGSKILKQACLETTHAIGGKSPVS
jgi:DNA-binding IclR family transcriptional regulator